MGDVAVTKAGCGTFVLLGALAGLGLFLVDTVRLVASTLATADDLDGLQWGYQLALMGLGGAGLGLLQWLGLRVSGVLLRQVASKLGGDARTAWQVGLLSAVIALPVAHQVFEGRSVRQLPVAQWGPWVLGLVLILGSVLVTRLWLAMCRATRPTRRVLAMTLVSVGLAIGFGALVWVDFYFYRGLYLQLHYTMSLLSFIVLQGLVYVWFGRRINRVREWRKVLILMPLLAFLAGFHARFEHVIPDRFPWHFEYTRRMIVTLRAITDFDRDGYSGFLAHGDLDGWNNSIHPMARDVPDNGIDEDCILGDLRSEDLAKAMAQYCPKKSVDRSILTSGLAGKPHIVLLSIDALRYDRLASAYTGAPPFHELEDFLKASVMFDRAYTSASFTERSLRIALTGSYTGSEDKQTFFQVLKAAGYRTVLSTTHTHARILRNLEDLTRGCDVVHAVEDGGDQSLLIPYGPTLLTSVAVVDRAIEVIRSPIDGPLCLWVHLFDLHQWSVVRDPRVASAADASDDETYDRFANFCARQCSRLLEELDRQPEYRNAVVLLTSDHGEGLGFKGYKGHTRLVHRPIVHVPLVFRLPGVAPRRIQSMVGLVDIAATITELAGVPRGDAEHSDGASLIPLMAGATTEHHPVVVVEDDYRAVMSGDHKLVVDIKEGRYALYDVDGDPGERWNLFMRPGYEALSREFYLLYQASPVSPVFNK